MPIENFVIKPFTYCSYKNKGCYIIIEVPDEIDEYSVVYVQELYPAKCNCNGIELNYSDITPLTFEIIEEELKKIIAIYDQVKLLYCDKNETNKSNS